MQREHYLPNKIQINQPMNQILFGPPGTGKTYHTVNKALAVIHGERWLEGKKRSELKCEFDQLIASGQIMFTTFHQSMTYEDFIEGIKPNLSNDNENGSIHYEIKEGLFRELCINASYEIAEFKKPKEVNERLEFYRIYDHYINELRQKLEEDEVVQIPLKTADKYLTVIEITSKNKIRFKTMKENGYTGLLFIEKIELFYFNPNRSASPEFNTYHRAIAEDMKQKSKDYKLDNQSESTNLLTMVEKKAVIATLTPEDYKESNGAKPFVLIIDEINRGNVSQVFGELITLIEEDKRLGKEEALTVKLPYSQTIFGVPPNLYIIGTMNTADRSVEALDTALRRRFSFKEMPPKPELISTEGPLENGKLGDINLVQLLKTLNSRLAQLLSNDLKIGHSYFMNVITLDDLKQVFDNKIIPLLQEYFFGDDYKMGLILGNKFVEKIEYNGKIFATFNSDEGNDYSDRAIYKINSSCHMDNEKFKLAIDALLQ